MIGKDKVLVLDIDGTLCPIKQPHEHYADLPVYPEMVTKLRALAAEGWRIILSSSRGMRTYDGNAGEILKHVFPVLEAWLKRHGVPYDEIHLAKPWPGLQGFYVDDRSVRPKEFLNHSLDELEQLMQADRLGS